MTVLICSPHPDDEMIGMGGTIAKLAQEGEKVVVVIFTLGEGSHLWQKKEVINKTREKEAHAAGKIAGTAKTIFLKLQDLHLSTEIVEQNASKKLASIIKREKPSMLFMPAVDDVHADHRAVANFVLSVHKEMKLTAPLWMYTVWNPLHFKYRNNPRMVVNISKTFRTKMKAIHAYESQKLSTFQLIPTVMLRGFINGILHGHNMAEIFIQAR